MPLKSKSAKFDTYHGCLAMPRSGDICIILRITIQEMSSTLNKLSAFGDTCVVKIKILFWFVFIALTGSGRYKKFLKYSHFPAFLSVSVSGRLAGKKEK